MIRFYFMYKLSRVIFLSVPSQGAWVTSSIVASRALKWFLSSVGTDVFTEIRSVGAYFTTQAARVLIGTALLVVQHVSTVLFCVTVSTSTNWTN